ncbi:polyprenol phosphomannose-dependent alpha 1,6 mannosyltransferase MptB, partial [Frankia sp. CiP3]|uniref:polyprenol phosphomannose-dependent alpha 1,6 mannosyltransferase MptB n=1 Tax=Frankia sp. CiP3 TaxID=2880971 RepID=UPI001EF410C6
MPCRALERMTAARPGAPLAGIMPRGGDVPTTCPGKGSSHPKLAEPTWSAPSALSKFLLSSLFLPGLLGLAGTCLVVGTAGRLALRAGVELPTEWFGLLVPVRLDRASALPAFMIVGVTLVVVAWLQLRLLASRGSVSLSQAGIIIAVWCLPVAVGPPVLSLDVYSYVAHGAMLTADLNPYRDGPAILGHQPSLLASDPVWRMSRAPYGPLALALLKAAYALSGGSVLGTVLILRLVALAGTIVIVGCVTWAAGPRQRPLALATAGNPVVILQLLGAIHLEAIMMALLAAGLLAARAGRPIPAMVLLTAATAVKWPAVFAIVAVAVWHAGTPAAGSPPLRAPEDRAFDQRAAYPRPVRQGGGGRRP